MAVRRVYVKPQFLGKYGILRRVSTATDAGSGLRGRFVGGSERLGKSPPRFFESVSNLLNGAAGVLKSSRHFERLKVGAKIIRLAAEEIGLREIALLLERCDLRVELGERCLQGALGGFTGAGFISGKLFPRGFDRAFGRVAPGEEKDRKEEAKQAGCHARKAKVSVPGERPSS